MNPKILIIAAVIFFLLINTGYFWEGKLGPYIVWVALVGEAIYLLLSIILLRELFFAAKEKFKNRKRVLAIAVLAVVLLLVFLNPDGIVNFDRLEGKDLLVAERRGTANSKTIFKLKENNRFIEKSFSFGITETRGSYSIKKDTIFFTDVIVERGENDYYMFCVIRPTTFSNTKIIADLVRYKNYNDTPGHVLWITKNDLNK